MTEISYMHPGEFRQAQGEPGTPYHNPRSITPERLQALKHSLCAAPQMLEARPFILDAERGDIVGGNQRHKGVTELFSDEGEKAERFRAYAEEHWNGGVPVYLKTFTSEAERREWLVRDNAPYGDWIPDELAALVKAHEDEGADLALLGLRPDETKDLLKLANDDDEIPDEPDDEIPPDTWGVVIECANEVEQADLLDELSDRGLSVRALIA